MQSKLVENKSYYDSLGKLKIAEEFFNSLALKEVIFNSPKMKCPKCQKKRTTYCLQCGELLLTEKDRIKIPKIQLPINLLVIHHEMEKHQKSSALPLQFLSDQVQVQSYPSQLNIQEGDYILFPHDNAKKISEMNNEEIKLIKRIIAIDCTWFQTKPILKDIDSLKQVKFIKLDNYKTMFWRYQDVGDECLATVEAIYYFYKELMSKISKQYQELDNLLFFYNYNFNLIKNAVNKEGKFNTVYDKMDAKKSKTHQAKLEQKALKKFEKNKD